MANRVMLVEDADLERSLSRDSGPIDAGLARWAIEVVSAKALELTGRTGSWVIPEDVPAGAAATIGVACRRLYTNPDRYTREAEGDYSYGLDASVTKADIFTASEERSLREYSANRTPRVKGIGTLSTYRGDAHEPTTVYVPDGTRAGFPWYESGDPFLGGQ